MLNEDLRIQVSGIPEKMTQGQFKAEIRKRMGQSLVQKVELQTKPLSLLSSGLGYLYFKTDTDMEECLEKFNGLEFSFGKEKRKVVLKLTQAPKISLKVALINSFNDNIRMKMCFDLPDSCKPPAHMLIPRPVAVGVNQ